jgi:AcrR family transcriptional regulator
MTKSDNTQEAPVRNQLTPQDWIDAAAKVLVSRSIDAVRVEVLAKDLGVSKGSFYWHFRDRNDLLTQVLASWRDGATARIISRFERQVTDPEQLIRELLQLPFRGEAARQAALTELAIRGWARRDTLARNVVDEVDAQRLAYIAHAFSALGFEEPEARARAFALYSYEISESLLASQGSAAEKEHRRGVMERMLLRR